MKLEDKAEKNNTSLEEDKRSAEERNKFMISNKPVFRRYAVGADEESYEFGLYHEEQNVKVEIQSRGHHIVFDDRCYNSQKLES